MKKRRTRSKVKNVKKQIYKGITFQSKLELYCYKTLNSFKIPVDYEKTTFTIFDALVYPQACYEGTKKKLYNKGSKIRAITYTPDFVDPEGKWIIETKGYLPSHHDFPMRWKIFLNHIMNNNLGYDVYLARNKQQVDQAVDEILKSIQNDKG